MTDTDTDSSSSDSDDPLRVRIRGIYTTALTQLVSEAGHEVVRASPPIRRRFDQSFPVVPETVRVATTDDRQGVGCHGTGEAVARLRDRLAEVAVDVFAWNATAPIGAIADARVTDTVGGGAILAFPAGEASDDETTDDGTRNGETTDDETRNDETTDDGTRNDETTDDGTRNDETTEVYLPFDAVDRYVESGDTVRVQVSDPEPPWTDDRPTVTTDIRAAGGLATLVRGRTEPRVAGGDSAAARELAGMTDLLDVSAPDGWGIEWARDATEAGMDALADALDTATARARSITDALDASPADSNTATVPRRLVTPRATAWVWFGRTARTALDDYRRSVTTTMPGHHRIKAGSRRASAGVDFAESVATFESDASFPFAAVTDQFGPTTGDTVTIRHGKPDGRAFSLGRATVIDRDADGNVTLEREMASSGTYDGLGTRRERGDTATTKVREDRWWYPTTYRGTDGTDKGTYVNVCTPVELFPDTVRYVDLHVDVVKRPDGTVERLDDDELDAAVERGDVSERLAERARSVATAVMRALSD